MKIEFNTPMWERRKRLFGEVIAVEHSDTHTLLFEPYDHEGDIMGGEIFRTEASFLEPVPDGVECKNPRVC